MEEKEEAALRKEIEEEEQEILREADAEESEGHTEHGWGIEPK